MLKHMLRWFSGFCEIKFPLTAGPALLTEFLHVQIHHWGMSRDREILHVFIFHKDLAWVLAEADKRAIPVEVVRVCGFPVWMHRYRNRWGLFFGTALFFSLVYISGNVVWDVRVTGNETMTEQEVVTLLHDFGFGVGTWFRNIDFDVLHNRFLMTTDQISFIAVNMQGNVAHVQIRETLPQRKTEEYGIANIVASEDGQIAEIHVYGGKGMVSIHDVVRKGDLLISGIQTVQEDVLHYERAAGKVLARVNRRIVVEVPSRREEKIYSGEERTEKTLIFFGKRIKLFQNSGISWTTYDTIITDTPWTFWNFAALPICFRTETFRAYRTEEISRNAAEVQLEAYSLYTKQLQDILLSSEVLSIRTTCESTENGVRLIGELVCLTDIAEEIPVPIA